MTPQVVVLLVYFLTVTCILAEANNEKSCSTRCQDHFEDCTYWKTTGQCGRPYMKLHCPQSCETCTESTVDLGVPQFMGGSYADKIRNVVETSHQYMMDMPHTMSCRNQHRECAQWAAAGLCEENPGLMQVQCAPSCQSCDKVDYESRCAFDNTTNIWGPGDMKHMMEKIVSNHPQTVFISPSVVVLDGFATDEEAKRLLEWGSGTWKYEYVEREVEDGVFERLIDENRTFSSFLCAEVCQQDEVIKSLSKRIEQVTGIPQANAEDIELRRYEQEQCKRLGHDYRVFEADHPQGVRIATMHLFLVVSDDDGVGGAILFPGLNATVLPQLGRAILWSNVQSDDPDSIDLSTQYSIEPATKDTLYSATVYLHQRDYKTSEKWACHQDPHATIVL